MFKTEDFFEILEYLKSGLDDPNIPPEIRQLAQNSKLQTQQFFKHVFDQVTFNSSDYNRLRKMIIDWYSSLKTYQDLGNRSRDAFSLPSKLLNVASKSFGFPYADGIGGRADKALFLYSLNELYKIKGSPKSIKSALEFFGIYDVEIYEWWLKRDPILDHLFFESSYVDLGGINPETLQTQIIPYDHMNLDAHWWYSQDKIKAYNETLPIRLPSITPYFTIQASASVDKMVQLYSVISKKISDQYTTYVDDNILDKSIFVDPYGQNLSLLELVLSIGYTYNEWTGRTYGSDSTSYIHYTGIEEDYDVIIDEYNNTVNRPTSRDDQKSKIEEFNENFTKEQLNNFLQSSGDTGSKLDFINPDYKEWIDEKLTTPGVIEELLGALLRELDIYIRMEFGIQALSFAQMMLGTDADDIIDVVNFFKPKRARLLAFNLVYAIDDPLFNSILLADTLYNRIRQWDQDTYDYYDKLNNTKITQWNNEYLIRNASGDSANSMGYDVGNHFDMMPTNVHDAFYTIIRQWQVDGMHYDDTFTIPYISQIFNEYGRSTNFDRCGIFDTRMQAWDCLHTVNIVQQFHDKAFMCSNLGYDRDEYYDACGRVASEYTRNKTFDSGFMFDVDAYPVPRTFDEGYKFDEGNGLFIPWWKDGDDPEKVCTCDIFNYSVNETPNDIVVVEDKDLIKSIMGLNFDTNFYFFRDELDQRIIINFSEHVMDAIRGFDNNHLFDQYSTLLRDTLEILRSVDTFKDNVNITERMNTSTNMTFNEVMETWPTAFDSDFEFDTFSHIIHDKCNRNIKLQFRDEVTDPIRSFDETGHLFDQYANILHDDLTIIVNSVPPP